MPITTAFSFVSDLPTEPALYALHGGTGRSQQVAYVGISGNLRRRIRQHFIRRDSSVVTGTSAATLNPDLITRIEWWLHDRFEERSFLQATELVASDVMKPTLRSRGKVIPTAKSLAKKKEVIAEVDSMLEEGPTGAVDLPTLRDALSEIESLKNRIAELETEIERLQDRS